MIEKPVAYGYANTAITGKQQTLMMVKLDNVSDQYPELAIPLFTESQLKAERERAIEVQLKINKELAETVTKLELEIARLISS
jgi:hypothetical protein